MLEEIKSPQDIKKLSQEKIDELSQEIRQYLLLLVPKTGGHLASNLGVVELTIAIHRVFDAPKDHIIFDVGHQCYTHKILTGRFPEMETLRTCGGISGFPCRAESVYDAFGTGHSSTSVSAGLGFAIADRVQQKDDYTVVVLGDGAYTGGLVHEALNNVEKNLKLIIILNDNEQSISKNTGRLADHLTKIRNRPSYFSAKKKVRNILAHIPLVGKSLVCFAQNVKKHIKNLLYSTNYFENMGLTYFGPVDGSDEELIERVLQEAKSLNESVLIHVLTKKGKGSEEIEKEPTKYHNVEPSGKVRTQPLFSYYVAGALASYAKINSNICVVSPAMEENTGFSNFQKKFPDRFFDVGIAEEHAVTFAAGLAANGMHPFVVTYSSFYQRAYDNILHDVALQNLPVTFLVDRIGLNAGDGVTHDGVFDVSFFNSIPNIHIFTPQTNFGVIKAIDEAMSINGPTVIRYPKSEENQIIIDHFYAKNKATDHLSLVADFDKNASITSCIISDGSVMEEAIKAIDGVQGVGLVLLEKIKPFSECAEYLYEVLPTGIEHILFLEEGILSGGMGMNFMTKLRSLDRLPNVTIDCMGIEDTFVKREKNHTIKESAHISSDYIRSWIKKYAKDDGELKQ